MDSFIEGVGKIAKVMSYLEKNGTSEQQTNFKTLVDAFTEGMRMSNAESLTQEQLESRLEQNLYLKVIANVEQAAAKDKFSVTLPLDPDLVNKKCNVLKRVLTKCIEVNGFDAKLQEREEEGDWEMYVEW